MKRLLFLLMLVSEVVYAGTDTQQNTLTGSALALNATQTVNGQRYNASGAPIPLGSRTFWIQNAYGLVKLSAPVTGGALGTASVGVSITYQTESLVANSSGVETLQYVPTTTTATLTVDFQSANATDISYFLAPNAQSVQITVTSVTNPNNLNLTLTSSVVTIGFDYLQTTIPSPTHSNTLTSGGDLAISWPAVTGAESYELEWTFISNQGMDANLNPMTIPFNMIAIPGLYFKTNSTRIETANTSYNIPLVFEQGYILYRLRAVGHNIVNSKPIWVKSDWSYLDAGAPQSTGGTTAPNNFPIANAYLYAGLEQNINWQSSLSLAEDGKNKVVVSYHDGTSRNRQAVTRINTDQRAIVGETMYDYNGRPIIQTLPVPLSNQALGMNPNFNYVDGQTTFRKADITSAGTAACNPTGPLLSTNSGSSQYYSPANTFSGTGNNTGSSVLNRDNIPDAQKYPYSQMVYTSDNTGRIATQSGFGATNSLGSGKETKYMYGTPLQTELCRLFGSNVGQAVHYKKNAVIDPNGQTSVSYLDMDGKVVATALAGVNPVNSNLDNITGNANTVRTISEDLIQTNPGSNVLNSDGTSKVFNKTFLVTTNQTTYNFAYTGTFGYYDIPCKIGSTNTSMNIDGVVDVYMTLQDKCGAILFSQNVSTVAGNTGQNQTVSIANVQQTLNPGTYQLVKEAVINEDKLNAYIQAYLASTCALQAGDFVQAPTAGELAECNLTCTSCNAEVNSLIKGGTLSPEQINTLQGLCAQLCDQTVGCTSYINAMMADVSPNGQYAQINQNRVSVPQTLDATQNSNGAYTFTAIDNMSVNNLPSTDASNTAQPENYPLSIFNSSNSLPLGTYLSSVLNANNITSKEYWRYPLFITRSGDNVQHPLNYQILTDENNQITLGNASGNGSNTLFTIGDYLDANGNIFYVYVTATVTTTTIGTTTTTTTTYSPDVLDPSLLSPVDQSTNLYKIKARWLKNVADFQNVWQSQWAYNLLPYHPEFPYYVDCISRDASNDFDYQVINITKQADAVTAGLLNANNTPNVLQKEGAYNLYGNGPVDAHPAPEAFYLAWMNLYLNNYFYNTNTNNSTPTPITLLANQMVNCPNGTPPPDGCGVTVNCNKVTIDTDAEWTTYMTLYNSVKQEFIKNVATFLAVNNGYYNGCIGHSNYISMGDDWYFDIPKPYTVSGSSYHCSRFAFWSFNCGWTNYSYTYSLPSYLIPNQVCFIGNAPYFENKTQRFFPASETQGMSTSENCANVVTDLTSTIPTYFIQPAPCTSDNQNQMDAATLQAQISQYELCGTCPMATDVESLLSQLTNNNKLITTSNQSLNCPVTNPAIPSISLGYTLSNALLGGVSSNSVIYWNGTLTSDKKTINATIQAGSNMYAVTLSIPAFAIPITDPSSTLAAATSAYTLDQLISVCCMTPSTTTLGAFTIRASFSSGNITISLPDIYINGSISNINLTNCSFAPSCVLTTDAVHTANFLNVLSSVPTGSGVNQSQLYSTTPVALFDNSTPNTFTSATNLQMYVDVVVDLLNIPSSSVTQQLIETLAPTWQAQTINSGTVILSGVLTYTLNTTAGPQTLNIQVTNNGAVQNNSFGTSIPSGSTVAGQPVQFKSLVASLPNTTCTQCANFGASMTSAGSDGSYSIQPVIINVPLLNPVNCTPVIPATVNRN
jgi:hypothetical protein